MGNSLKIRVSGSFLILFLSVAFIFPLANNIFMYDDKYYIQGSPQIESLKGIYDNTVIRKPGTYLNFRPVELVSLYANYKVFGHDAFAYKLTNLLLHALASILLFHAVSSLWGYGYRSLVLASLFAVHPIHIESIGIIYNRSEMLALISLCLSFIFLVKNDDIKGCFLSGRRGNDPGKGNFLYLCISVLFFFLALCSKETSAGALAALFIFVITRCLIDRKSLQWKPVGWVLLMFVSVFLIYVAIRHFSLGRTTAGSAATYFKGKEMFSVFATVSRIFKDYVLLMIAPLKQQIDYVEYPLSVSFFSTKAVLSYLLNIGLLAFSFIYMKRNRLLSFSILAFYAALLPVSHIVPFLDIKSERFLYIPSVFYCLALASLFKGITERNGSFRILMAIYAVLVIFYGSLAYGYSGLFRSEKAFWTEMANRAPRNMKFQLNLGNYYLWEERDYKKAIVHIEEAMNIHPKWHRAYASLGAAYYEDGKIEKARKTFEEGLSLFPNYQTLNINYSVLNLYTGDIEKAKEYIEKAKIMRPETSDVVLSMDKIEEEIRKREMSGN